MSPHSLDYLPVTHHYFNKNMKSINILKLSLITLIVFSHISPVYSRNYGSTSKAINQSKNTLQNTKSKLQQGKQLVEKLRRKENETNFRIAVLQQKIETSSIKLADAQYRYQQTQKQIRVTDSKLKETEKELKDQIKHTKSTVKRLYKYRYIDFMLFLLHSDDISKLMRRSVYFNYILKQDNELINEIKKKKEDIRDLKQDYRQKQVKIVTISKKIVEQKDIYEEASEDQTDYLQKVQHQKGYYEREVQALENESNRIYSLLKSLVVRQKLEKQRILTARRSGNKITYSYATRNVSVPAFSGGRMGWPSASSNLTSYYGYRVHPIFGTRKLHSGIDIGAGAGTPTYAAADGIVVEAGWTGGYGKAVIIDHGGGIATLYGHSSQLYVAPGQSVKRGQLIAACGSTGFSTGPHLHFEVRVNGSPVDPLAYLR